MDARTAYASAIRIVPASNLRGSFDKRFRAAWASPSRWSGTAGMERIPCPRTTSVHLGERCSVCKSPTSMVGWSRAACTQGQSFNDALRRFRHVDDIFSSRRERRNQRSAVRKAGSLLVARGSSLNRSLRLQRKRRDNRSSDGIPAGPDAANLATASWWPAGGPACRWRPRR